jgi:probable addiction module antidote protein
MNKRLRGYQEDLLESLKDPREAIEYLNAALMDEDQRVFLLAVRNVLEARGETLSSLARESNLNRENLTRILSAKGNPRLDSIRSMLHTMGFELAIQSINHERRS